jgi:hypothetical protein
MSQYYKKLGKLPIEVVEFFKKELLNLKEPDKPYQWIQFDQNLNKYFLGIFFNTELKVQYDLIKNRYVQKAFYSEPGHGFRIHRDGVKCKSALNIAISCNETDWVRWYDNKMIENLSKPIEETNNPKFGLSRNVDIDNYENVPYIDQLHNEIGDVYALDVDTFHSFKCLGPEPRIIIQTKFANFPTFQTIVDSLNRNSFSNLINYQA